MMTNDATLPLTGATLIEWGHRPGPQFPALLARANAARASGLDAAQVRAMLAAEMPPPPAPKLPLQSGLGFHSNIQAEDADEAQNIEDVALDAGLDAHPHGRGRGDHARCLPGGV